jgi:4-alpha-glucanotransferase
VVYTGTHDNNTSVGWFQGLSEEERERVRAYLGRDGADIAWDLLRLALMSVADLVVIPFQDVLRLGPEARMNTPGLLGQNWAWRFRAEALNDGLASGLRFLTAVYDRLPAALKPVKEEEGELEYHPVEV